MFTSHTFTQSCIMSSEILGPQIQIWPPRWPPQTDADRNAPAGTTDTLIMKENWQISKN